MIRTVATALVKVSTYLIVFLGVILALNTLSYLNLDPNYGFLRLKQHAIATGWYLPFYYSHIFAGALVLIAGFIQFSESIRKKWLRVHRLWGYVYVAGIVILAAPGGMVMSFFVDRGFMVELSFIMQCTLWVAFTAIAFNEIRKRNIETHKRWMTRSFALTLAAVSLRIYIYGSSWFVDLSSPGAYATIAWCSWVLNLLIAEWIIYRKITLGNRPLAPGLGDL